MSVISERDAEKIENEARQCIIQKTPPRHQDGQRYSFYVYSITQHQARRTTGSKAQRNEFHTNKRHNSTQSTNRP